jgi:hypothetical protein
MTNIILGGSTPDDGFELKSCRFNFADSAYLSRTPGSAGNQRTWTVSFWYKRTDMDNYASGDPYIFAGEYGTLPLTVIGINRDDVLWVRNNSAGSYDINLKTTQVFRDVSAWYHIVVAMDTTQATEANRTKIYVNGSQVTAFSTETYPTQNLVTGINAAGSHMLMKGDSYHSGYLAEFYLIDGTQLTPASFGETDAATNQWQPIDPTDIKPTLTFGTNGFYLPFSNDALATSFADSATSGTELVLSAAVTAQAEAVLEQLVEMDRVQTLVELAELVELEYKMLIALDRMYTMLVAVVQELCLMVPVVLEEMVVAVQAEQQQLVRITQPQLRILEVVVREVKLGIIIVHL